MTFDTGRKIIPCNYVKVTPYGTSRGNIEVFIPSIMKKWGMGVPKITPTSLNSSIYNNASDCKPTVSVKTNTQNYATARAPVSPYKLSLYSFGSGMEIWPVTEDVLNPRLTTENVDNSWTF